MCKTNADRQDGEYTKKVGAFQSRAVVARRYLKGCPMPSNPNMTLWDNANSKKPKDIEATPEILDLLATAMDLLSDSWVTTKDISRFNAMKKQIKNLLRIQESFRNISRTEDEKERQDLQAKVKSLKAALVNILDGNSENLKQYVKTELDKKKLDKKGAQEVISAFGEFAMKVKIEIRELNSQIKFTEGEQMNASANKDANISLLTHNGQIGGNLVSDIAGRFAAGKGAIAEHKRAKAFKGEVKNLKAQRQAILYYMNETQKQLRKKIKEFQKKCQDTDKVDEEQDHVIYVEQLKIFIEAAKKLGGEYVSRKEVHFYSFTVNKVKYIVAKILTLLIVPQYLLDASKEQNEAHSDGS